MVKTPGTCRRISLLCTKHSSTNKLDNSETSATTTMNKAKRLSAKSMSQSRKSVLEVDDERSEPTMVPPSSSASAVQRAEARSQQHPSSNLALVSHHPRRAQQGVCGSACRRAGTGGELHAYSRELIGAKRWSLPHAKEQLVPKLPELHFSSYMLRCLDAFFTQCAKLCNKWQIITDRVWFQSGSEAEGQTGPGMRSWIIGDACAVTNGTRCTRAEEARGQMDPLPEMNYL